MSLKIADINIASRNWNLLIGVWVQEVEQMKELLEIVLQRSAGQQKLVLDVVFGEVPEEERLLVLQTMSFINNDRLPFDARQECLIRVDHFVGRQKNVKLQPLGVEDLDRFLGGLDCSLNKRKVLVSKRMKDRRKDTQRPTE